MEFFSPQAAFLASLFLLALGGVGALLLKRNDECAHAWAHISAAVAGVFGIASSVSVLLYDSPFSFVMQSSAPLVSFSFRVDTLSAFFVFTISLMSLVASVYGLGYMRHFFGRFNLAAFGFFYNAFIAGMLLVASADNAIFFLIAWELMSLASYFLVVFEHDKKENLRAGTLYFIMTHISTAFIMVAFILIANAVGSFEFSAWSTSAAALTPSAATLVFLCALVGFGTKAGIIPLHVWLPEAHPAAPSHVSALMSGVMIKTGIYMLIRILLDIFQVIPLWWGGAVLLIASVSSILGVLYALTEHDMKRLLAYHSIENIGIILFGIGSAMVFASLNMRAFALLALAAALFHTLNHAVFKGLLFLSAGSVIMQTHTRNIEEYGGLMRLMPYTGLFFLVGAMAISGLPPLNGFASEWMTFQALFMGMAVVPDGLRWMFIVAAGTLAFTSGLAAACFVKAFGASFLARPRSVEAEQARESHPFLLFGMAALAVLSVVLGVFSASVAAILAKVAGSIGAFAGAESLAGARMGTIFLKNDFAAFSPPAILSWLIFAAAFAFLAVGRITKRRKVVLARTWDCGTDLSPRMEITATGFSRSLVTIFRGILRPSAQTTIEYKDSAMRYFPHEQKVTLTTSDMYQSYFYSPIQRLITRVSEHAKRIQSGLLNAYVAYLFSILIILIVLSETYL